MTPALLWIIAGALSALWAWVIADYVGDALTRLGRGAVLAIVMTGGACIGLAVWFISVRLTVEGLL